MNFSNITVRHFSIYFFAFFACGKAAPAHIGFFILLLSLLFEHKDDISLEGTLYKKQLKHLILFTLAWLGIVTTLTLYQYFQEGFSRYLLDDYSNWIYLSCCIVIGIFLSKQTLRFRNNVIISSLLGYFLSIMSQVKFDFINYLIEGKRLLEPLLPADSGFNSSILFMLATLLLISSKFSKNKKWFFLINALILSILIIFLLSFLIAAQNRSSWIALSITAFILFVYFTCNQFSLLKQKLKNKFNQLTLILFFGITSATLIFNSQTLIDRTLLTIDSIAVINKEKSQHTSLDARSNMLTLGFYMIAQKPFLGWGPSGDTGGKVKETDLQKLSFEGQYQVKNWNHVHNTYLELWIRLGLPSLIIMAIAFYPILTRQLTMLKEQGDSIAPWFTVSIMLITAIIYLTDFRLLSSEGKFPMILFWSLVIGYLFDEKNITDHKPME